MKTLLVSFLAVFLTIGFAAPDAEAKRFGGGKSFGMQRSAPAKQSAAPAPQRQQSAAPGQAAPQKRNWMGPIAGLAAGLGLAALFSHLGMGEEMANFLMIALLAMAAFMLFRWFMRKNVPAAPAMQYAGAQPTAAPVRFDAAPVSSGSAVAGEFPPGFDAVAFAREAKLNFIRLQAAFDAGNLDDLRAFTSPEVFAELSMQLAERGDSAQHTDVLHVDAEVLEALDENGQHVASVRFTGEVREAEGDAPVALNEVWHLTRAIRGAGGWIVSGIQQA